MLSYRHVYHAGNFGDVLKHAILIRLLDHLNQKDKPYWVIDLFAGAGGYRLDAGRGKEHGEWRTGIGRLWRATNPPPLLLRYLAAVRAENPDGKLRRYPGSPLLALRASRACDRLRFFELHPTDIRLLAETIAGAANDATKRTTIRQEDGFLALPALLPPPPRRGLVIIDPPYEDKRDYARVVTALKDLLDRFPTGLALVWYPWLARRESQELPQRLRRLASRWLDARLVLRPPAPDDKGMPGCGVFVLNPPATLHAATSDALPWLADVLGEGSGSSKGFCESFPFPSILRYDERRTRPAPARR
ncbi:MAG: 23S rRNA (adenine(2030)-N(6))-methyltransferase RlmJ [Rhodocyclaceae bacterium]|nr:23S rRNA (adenine(2030)-N(6))-methyltransferase RlmJ [Rhodocyclaceae bacterium]